MKFTPVQVIAFHNWEIDMMEVKAIREMMPGVTVMEPEKPQFYDIWRQGGDPLFKNVDTIRCQGGGLVPGFGAPETTQNA